MGFNHDKALKCLSKNIQMKMAHGWASSNAESPNLYAWMYRRVKALSKTGKQTDRVWTGVYH